MLVDLRTHNMTIYNFELLNVPFANTAVASEIAPFPDYNRGFGIAFSLTDGKPEMKGFNGLLKMVTTSIIYLKQRGISEWDSTFEYVAGKSFVIDGDKLYQAKTTNTNKQPSLSQNDWILRASISDIKVSTNGNLKRTENQDGTITLEVPTASTDQRGAVRQATSTEVANKANVNAYVTPKNVADMTTRTTREVKLPDGTILRWGFTDFIGGSNTLHQSFFDSPFPNECLFINIGTRTQKTTSAGCQRMAQYVSHTKSSFEWYSDEFVSGGAPISATYFAVGY